MSASLYRANRPLLSLILLLLLFDFGKAVVLLWYPARVLVVSSAYDNRNFCDVVGFFTSSFIEGADLAVFFLAVHTALLVFVKFNGKEGGLYKFRYYVYGVNFLLPLVMAALVFIDHGRAAYKPYITWCYLPIRPIWYRLVLSWVPRYIIIVSIIAIYVSIYVYVKVQYREVVKNFSESQRYAAQGIKRTKFGHSFSGQTRHVAYSILSFIAGLPGFAFLQPIIDRKLGIFEDSASNDSSVTVDPQVAMMMEIQRDQMKKFEIRRNNIERQIRSIFVYPTAYVFLWLAPFGLQCIQYNYEFEHGTLFWISAAAAFMQPFNCFVDSVAFFIRERPLKNREEKIFTKENGERVKRAFTFERTDSLYRPPMTEMKRAVVRNRMNTDLELAEQPEYNDKDTLNTNTDDTFSPASDHSHRSQKYSTQDTIYSFSNAATRTGTGHKKQSSEQEWVDPFSATTARRIDQDDNDGTSVSDSGSQVDILEFLR